MRSHFNYFAPATLLLILSFPAQIAGIDPNFPDALVQNQASQTQQEAEALFTQGMQQAGKREYQAALMTYQKALAIYRKIGDRVNEGAVLRLMGEAYADRADRDDYSQALQLYQQALDVHQKIPDKKEIGKTLNDIGNVYQKQGKYPEALARYQRSLDIWQELGDKEREGEMLNNFGVVYLSQGRYRDALKAYEQAKLIFTMLGKKKNVATALDNIGLVRTELGQYDKARENYRQALKIRREMGERRDQGTTLQNIGFSYTQEALTPPRATTDLDKTRQENYAKAKKKYNQALVIFKEISDREGEAFTLNNLGFVQTQLGEHAQALKSLEQALGIFKEIGNRPDEADTLDTMGTVYKNQGQYSQSLEVYQQGLAIQREVGILPSERVTLSNIGDLFQQQGQVELAIAFYKKAVNITEKIRADIRDLSREEQGDYKQVVAKTYRSLADLLLQQNRVMEALEVLDLLKVQELQDYLKNVEGNPETAKGIELLPQEKKLENIKLTELLSNPEAKKSIEAIRQTAVKQQPYQKLQKKVQKLGQNSALFYPLILDKRLELVLFTPNSPPFHPRARDISKDNLKIIIEGLSNDLRDPEKPLEELQDDTKKLYELLIAPIKGKLDLEKIQTIIYAPDGMLRQIPIAALHDGNQWLIEQFRINYITAISLTNIKMESSSRPRILAGAYTQGGTKVRGIDMPSIPSARIEIDHLAHLNLGNTTQSVNSDFNVKAISPENMNSYDIVHLATHASFVSGPSDNSFILLADGNYITLSQVEGWKKNLPNVSLMVLSACETALGDGIEIIGFGYQLQVAQAKAAIATLWKISDPDSPKLMDAFYTELKNNPKIPKAEALRLAQIKLISDPKLNLRHPYFWAPFILIGNGL